MELRSDDATTANVLTPKSGGILQEICVKEGERVKAGDKIAVLKNPQLDSELNSLIGQAQETRVEIDMCRQMGNNQEAVARLQEALARYEGLVLSIRAMQ